MVKILPDNGSYELITPYDQGFIGDLKALIPYGQRTYNRDRKSWTVSAKYASTITELCRKYFHVTPALPDLGGSVSKLGLLTLYYIGKTKPRSDGSRSAFGWMPDQRTNLGSWAVVFPEKVLRSYFEPNTDGKAQAPSGNYYEVLGIGTGAGPAEVKSAYRRMVKQWHPDVCKDPDAHEIFIGIQKAYEILNDPKKKARYDVGLKLEASTVVQPKRKLDLNDDDGYRSPLKCGALLCEYSQIGSRYIVERILQWEDIYNPQGQTLVTSWERDATEPTLCWV